MKQLTQKFVRRNGRSGQALIEYALIVALISVVTISVLRGIGTSISNKLAVVNASLQ